jgi:hypothetical protein
MMHIIRDFLAWCSNEGIDPKKDSEAIDKYLSLRDLSEKTKI